MARGPLSSELGNSAVLDTHSLWVGGSVFACWEREVGHFAQCFLAGSFSSVESGVHEKARERKTCLSPLFYLGLICIGVYLGSSMGIL